VTAPERHVNRTSSALLLLATAAAALAAPARAAPPGSPWDARYFGNAELVTQDGRTVRFYDDLLKDKHVVVSFVFTNCTRQCGLITANLARVQRALGDRVGKDIFFYSITLDPKRDTPAALKQYAAAFKAGPGWTFLTGSEADLRAIRKRFGDLAPIEDHSAAINVGNDAVGQWWHTSALDSPAYLATVIGDWMDPAFKGRPAARSYAEAAVPTPPTRAEVLFRDHCQACHLPGGASVGPDLAGVAERRGREWLHRWIRRPGRLVDEGDPAALELLERSGGVLMPTLELAEADWALLETLITTGPAFARRDAGRRTE
jgi:protein SCO1/2